MNISELFRTAETITNAVPDIEKTTSKLEEELEKKPNKDTEKIKQLEKDINEGKDTLKRNKTKLSEITAEIMKYKEIRVVFEEEVKDEIQKRCEPYTAVNNIYRELIENVLKKLDKKYKEDGINKNDIDAYGEYFENYDKILKDLEAGEIEKHKELCKFLDEKDKNESKGYAEKYRNLKVVYEEKITVYNYRMYNKTMDAKTESVYTQILKDDVRTKYESTIEQLINNQTQRIEEIAKNLDNNEALKMGIEKYFKFHTCDEKKELLSKDDLDSKKELIKYLIKQYADIPVRQDMTKRERVYTKAMEDADARIKELLKEYGNSKEEKEVKSDNLNSKGTNVEENTYTVIISQEELKKIYENRTKQTIEKKEEKEEKENISKTFFNGIKEMYKKIFSKKEDIEEIDPEEKNKDEEKTEIEEDNKQKEENSEGMQTDNKQKEENSEGPQIDNKQKEEPLKELSENEIKYIYNKPKYSQQMIDILLKDEVAKVVDPLTKKAEQLKDDAKVEKEQDNQDEIER